jgi:hypothetical protein
MKISALLFSTLLLFSSVSFAECGLDNSGKVDAESSELCKENLTINIQKAIRINDINASFVLEGDEAHAVAIEEYTNDTHKENNAIISASKKSFNFLIWQAFEILSLIAMIHFIYKVINSEEKQFKMIATYAFFFLLSLIANLESYSVNKDGENSKIAETLMTELVVKAEKISMLSIRKFLSIVDRNKINKEEYESTVKKSLDTQRMNTFKLAQNYRAMRQTDKVYAYIEVLDGKRNPLNFYNDANSFIRANQFSIDFSRTSNSNSLHHLYTLKPIQLDTVDFSKYGNVMQKINISQYITDDYTQAPEKIQALSEKLHSIYDNNTENDNQRINNILTDFGMVLRNEIRKKYILETWAKLEKIYQLQIKYTCTRQGDLVQTSLFIKTGGKEGVSECLYIDGGTVVNPIAAVTADMYKDKKESEEQKKTLSEINKAIDELSVKNTEIENSLMELSLTSLTFNDTSYYLEKMAKGGLLDTVTYIETYITKSQFQSLTSSAIMNNDVFIPVKQVGKFSVDMETLSKENLNVVRKELDFTKTDNAILDTFKLTDSSNGSSKSIQSITQSYYEANGNSNSVDLFKALMSNPTQSLLAKLGIKKDCYADCEIYTAFPSYAIKQTSSELLVSSIRLQTYAAGLFAVQGAVNKTIVEKQKNKSDAAEIRNKSKSSKGSSLQKATAIAGLVATAMTALAIIPEIIGFLGSVVLPILDKAPYYVSVINYNIFVSLAPILVLLITLSLISMKQSGYEEYKHTAKSLIAISIIILFEQVKIFLVMIFIIGFRETAYWSLAFIYNTTGFGTGVIEGTISFCVFIVLILTIASVFAVIGVRANHFSYEAIGITPVHNTNAGNVNDKWNNIIAKTLPAIFLLSETIKSFAKNKNTNNENKG